MSMAGFNKACIAATSRMPMKRDILSFGRCCKRDCSADLEAVNTTGGGVEPKR